MRDIRSAKRFGIVGVTIAMAFGTLGVVGGSSASAVKPSKSNITTIPVGVMYAITGPNSTFVPLYQNGINLVLGKDNAALEKFGYKLRPVYGDTQNSATLSLSVFNQLVSQDHIPVTLIAGGSPTILSNVPTAQQQHVLILQTGADSPLLVNQGQYLVNLSQSGILESQVTDGYAYKVLHLRRLAIISENDSFGVPLGQAAASQFIQLGGQVVTSQLYSATTTNYSSLITSVLASNPDGVYCACVGPAVGPIIAQARQLGLNVPFFGTTSFQNGASIGLNPQDSNVYWDVADLSPSFSWAAPYFKSYNRKYHSTPIFSSAVQSDAFDFLTTAIEYLHSKHQKVNGTNLNTYFQNHRHLTGYMGPYTLAKNGATVLPLGVNSQRGGVPVTVATPAQLQKLGVLKYTF